jgi:hypothetical protein
MMRPVRALSGRPEVRSCQDPAWHIRRRPRRDRCASTSSRPSGAASRWRLTGRAGPGPAAPHRTAPHRTAPPRLRRTAEAALDALAGYLPRYLVVVRAAGQEPPDAGPDGPEFTLVERVPGNATTTFGAPGVVPTLDAGGWSGDAADRQAR